MGGLKVKAAVLLASSLLLGGLSCALAAPRSSDEESISMLLVAETTKEAAEMAARGLESFGLSKDVIEAFESGVYSDDPEWRGFRVVQGPRKDHPRICIAVVRKGTDKFFDVKDYFSLAVAGSAARVDEVRYFKEIAYEFYLETQKEHCRASGWERAGDERDSLVKGWEEEAEVFEAAARAVAESGKFKKEDVALFVENLAKARMLRVFERAEVPLWTSYGLENRGDGGKARVKPAYCEENYVAIQNAIYDMHKASKKGQKIEDWVRYWREHSAGFGERGLPLAEDLEEAVRYNGWVVDKLVDWGIARRVKAQK